MLNEESVVAAVRDEADGEQVEVLASNPRDLRDTDKSALNHSQRGPILSRDEINGKGSSN